MKKKLKKKSFLSLILVLFIRGLALFQLATYGNYLLAP